jgi:SSS family solute:Na+ symporter
MIKLTVQAFFGKGKLEQPALLAAFGDFNFLYFTGVLFVISIAIVITASLMTPPPPAEKTAGLTYAGASAEDRRLNRASWNRVDILLTAAVLGGVLLMYLYFSFWLR